MPNLDPLMDRSCQACCVQACFVNRGHLEPCCLGPCFLLTSVGVIQFVFIFSKFCQLDSHKKKRCVALAKLQWRINTNRMEELDVPWFSYAYRRHTFLKWTHRSSHLCTMLSVEKSIKLEDAVESLLNMYSSSLNNTRTPQYTKFCI